MRKRGLDPGTVVKLTMLLGAPWLPRAIQVAATLGIGEILLFPS